MISKIYDPSPVNEIVWTNDSMNTTLSQVSAGTAVLFYVVIDNSTNPSQAAFVKIFDAASGVTLGVTPPDLIFRASPGMVSTTTLHTSIAFGFTFSNGIIAACTNSGGTTGVSSPLNSVAVSFVFV